MFIQSKEGRQFSFSIEISSKEIEEQTFAEAISYFDKTKHRQKDFKKIEASSNIDIPAKVFRTGNNGLRAIVKYLKDEKKCSFSRIGKLLSRDQRTIWCAYKAANSTHKKEKITRKNEISQNIDDENINTSVFADRNYSILENAAIHLLKKYSVKETAQILGRNQMTIWTVKRRADLKAKVKKQDTEKKRIKK